MTATRKCLGPCAEVKLETAFELKANGYRRRTCFSCRNKSIVGKDRKRHSQYRRNYRRDNPHIAITGDCRSSDKKAGLVGNDITSAFVKELISKGCSYCGEASIRITLDRIDNSKAHTQKNVVPCCIRCNYIRGSMPHKAWLHLVPAVCEAREKGLFGEWRATPFNRKTWVVTGARCPISLITRS